ncbi:hypothetical protein BBO99_00007944 [Phytophthora kernoviae]|uniref:glycerol-3-phosphate dehydrogenase (NAD(+)) n=2 Tax=Phytophthora kernoviae TaxID=325452 RepID=A0A421GGC6_9STRA|nr:hypothetical protein G195_005214 [Phytophthora kernoviae 00238/432]KAG2516577.1 hypothetical protein JM16_007603 [Phytophthora kernoviae]KAG2519738.1 hypothetical protein JM18_007467 [Phytophthora kernoviae]RLN31932.1 hypothetical protein BBI17_007826 [Phytophthora kernoviae]RLN75945.1 hypothetical protein BBO99_00007944 [Phytophthora kernoviae]
MALSGATFAGIPSAEVEKVKVAVLAAGAFGIAMATLAARRKHDVVLYARDADAVASINESHKSPRVFPQYELLPNIRATTSVAEATEGAKMVIVCLPAQLTPDFLTMHRDEIPTDAREQPLAFLSGPSFALELMNNAPSAVVVASKLLYHAVYVQRRLSTVDFRIYSSQDIVGVQLGGALKNPLAIGAGMVEGAGYGINTLAAFVTRSSLELQKLCLAMGGQPITISGLSGIGDLMLTAFGSLSRNRTFGLRLIQGENAEDLLRETTVEGVPTAEVAVYFAEQCGLDLPIFRTVNAMIKGEVKREQLQEVLMNRPLKSET